ncbi:MAG: phosphatidate cytidylyltransferase, partial [Burkholderiaceae bacterium]|nr:phosphatidate cytidylyltransferase [Burkholderiaceae bacterium]
MLKQRVITAIVLLAIIVAAYMVSEVAFALVMGVGFTLALWEWLKFAGITSKSSALVSAVVGITMMTITYLIYWEVSTGTINETACSSLFTGFALY